MLRQGNTVGYCLADERRAISDAGNVDGAFGRGVTPVVWAKESVELKLLMAYFSVALSVFTRSPGVRSRYSIPRT